MSLCLFGAGKSAALAVSAFTLAWTHSVEKIEWQEDWRVTPAGLVLDAARVKGSGAGMEPPPEARLEQGWWRWHPGGGPRSVMVLRRSGVTADWRLCANDGCRALGDILSADPVALSPCD